MDKSLRQQLYGSASRSSNLSSVSRTQASSTGSFSPTMSRKSLVSTPLSPAMKKIAASNGHGRYSNSGRSNQSMLGIRSDFNVIESYGFQLPVVVDEVLNLDERTQGVSVMCAENGWAWVVYGRRLLIWQYKDTRSAYSPPRDGRTPPQRRGAMAQCRELTLPHCDIGHKASLVSVFISDGQQMASCVAVSPTGDARYWTSIAHDGSSVDVTCILDGQEFDHILSLPKHQNYILVTTTCNLVLLQLQLVNGRHVIHHKAISAPSGFLGGLGAKMASVFIGMHSGNEKENKFISISCESGDVAATVTVLADRWVQRWRIAYHGNSEELLYEDGEIIRALRDEFQQKFWNIRNPADGIEINLQLLDMHISDGKIYVLGGAVNVAHTPQMYYGIAVLTPGPDCMRLENFIPLKLTQYYGINTERECLGLRFIIARTLLYLYTDKVVYPLNLSNPTLGEIEAEKIELNLQEDRILSASVCGNIPLFFSRAHGLICVTPSDFDSSDVLNMTITDVYSPMSDSFVRDQNLASDTTINENNLHMFQLDPDAMYNEFKDEVSQLKAAFIYRLKQNHSMCNTILKGVLRSTTEVQYSSLSDGNQLDKVVFTIAEDLAEDIPAADPRWEQLWEENSGCKHALGSSSSLQIITQLKEKNAALRHFVEFLHATDIWDKLSSVPTAGSIVPQPTCYAVSDINEKIIAAIALRSLQNKYANIINDAINRVVSRWDEETPLKNLTAQDLFYVRITKFQDIFKALSNVANSRIDSPDQSSVVAGTIADINAIVLNLVSETIEFREQNTAIYSPPADKLEVLEYLPWTAMSGKTGIRESLSHLVDISVSHGARCAVEPELKQLLYQQILELVDFILDGQKSYLDSVRDSEKYNVLLQQFEAQRRDLISILIKDGQYEFAAKLAEKYLDFQSLMIICDETKNQDRLDSYVTKYEEYDFARVAINWYMRQKRTREVFERFKGHPAALSQFIHEHPSVGWIQLVFNRDMEGASKTLFELAMKETEFVQRKKTMLSLAKLAALAAGSDLSMQVANINAQLKIVQHQERLNEEVLRAFGFDTKEPKVLKVEEIINLLISEENVTANEQDFHKALELLGYMEDPYELRHKIWCAAILRNNWIDYNADTAVDYLQNLLVFKLIELCHLMDGDLDNFLPPIDDFLNSAELEDLVHNKSYQFLLKLMYEYTANTFRSSDDRMKSRDLI